MGNFKKMRVNDWKKVIRNFGWFSGKVGIFHEITANRREILPWVFWGFCYWPI